MKFVKPLVLLVSGISVASLFSGCATILSGTTEKISVNSNPSGIKFKLDNAEYTTPAVITVKRENEDKIIQVENPQCKKTIVLNKKINPVFFVNILSGGVFGSTTDYLTGAMWKYDDNVNIDCR